MGVGPGPVREADQLEARLDAARLGLAERHVGRHRQVGEEGAVLEHHPDVALLGLDPRGRPHDGAPTDRHRPGVGDLEARDHAKHGRLAGSAGTEQRHQLAALDGEGGVAQRRGPAERLVDADGVDRGRGRHGDGPYRIALGGLLRRCEDHLTPKYTAARPSQKVVMVSRLIRMRWPIPVAVLVLLVAVVAVAVLANRDDGPTLVVYNGRSHYGDEQVFEDFERGDRHQRRAARRHRSRAVRTAPAGGADTPADVLVTTDLANLWRADDAGLLAAVDTPTLEANMPEALHDPDGAWWALSTRHARPGRLHRARRPGHGHHLRVPRRPRSSGAAPACGPRPTSTTSRSSPT